MVAGACLVVLCPLRVIVSLHTALTVGVVDAFSQAATHYDLNANGEVSVEEFRLALNEYVVVIAMGVPCVGYRGWACLSATFAPILPWALLLLLLVLTLLLLYFWLRLIVCVPRV